MYKPGQKLICIVKGQWGYTGSTRPVPGPKYGEEVTLNNVAHNGYLWLNEYLGLGCYDPKGFRPPVDISDEVKESLSKIVEEKIEQPILEPA